LQRKFVKLLFINSCKSTGEGVKLECDSLSNLATKMVVGGEEPSNQSLLLSPFDNHHLVNTLTHVDVASMCDMSACIDNLPNFSSNSFATVVSCPSVLTASTALSATVVIGTQALQNGALTPVCPSGTATTLS